MCRLERDFFARDTLAVARDSLRKRLVRKLEGRRISGRIVEVEAYIGEADEASHASPGPTERNASMYGPPGYAYVYFIYGMHYCLNIVTEREGYPAAVLIRALEPVEGLEEMRSRRGGRSNQQLTSGPARLCEAFGIDRRFDGLDLCTPDARLFIEANGTRADGAVATSPRINVRGDEAALNAPWRFYVQGNRYVSR